MGTILSTIFISAPLAFLAGWLLCKTLFSHMLATRLNTQVNEQVNDKGNNKGNVTATSTPNNLQTAAAQTHNETNLIHALKQRLTISQTDSKAARDEVRLLEEAIAERDHQLLKLRQQLAVTITPPEEAHAGVEAIKNLSYAKEKRLLEQDLEAREHETAQLRCELVTAENRLEGAGRRFTLWRKRIKPLTKRIRQQRIIMHELREEMRQREPFESGLYQQSDLRPENEMGEAAAQTASSNTEVQQDAVMTPPPVEVPEAQDNLRKIRGIGKALERKLHDQGIFRMQQLAELGDEELAKLGKTLGISDKLMTRNDWAKQARELLGLPERIAETGATAQAEAISA